MQFDEINNDTKEININQIINSEDKLNLLNNTTKLNLWIPKDYNNLVSKTNGKIKLDIRDMGL